MEIRFYDQALDSDLKCAVVCARAGEKWLLCRRRDRQTWELPGGDRTPGEECRLMDALPEELTRPELQPALIEQVRQWLEEGNFRSVQEDIFELMM